MQKNTDMHAGSSLKNPAGSKFRTERQNGIKKNSKARFSLDKRAFSLELLGVWIPSPVRKKETQFSDITTSATSTDVQNPVQSPAHLQLPLPIPVTVGLRVPGTSAFLNRFEELVDESQGGVI